jgi:ArsR family metal-binding transcriptional regulator
MQTMHDHTWKKRQQILPDQRINNSQLAAILLSLVATNRPHSTMDKISENTSNIIKVVAYLLEEATVAKYIEAITHQITDLQKTNKINTDNTKDSMQIKNMISNLNDALNKHNENIQKATDAIKKIQCS